MYVNFSDDSDDEDYVAKDSSNTVVIRGNSKNTK